MNESIGKTTSSSSSCMAITEKKTVAGQSSRPGGCVGIFFQLFDWNRRLAKKKLFSKKLLPPSRAKQVSKKFGDEKMPTSKLHLIADENKGGFPNAKKNGNRSGVDFEHHKHELRAPSLVARLMGLESMPATRDSNKLKKAAFADACDGGEKGFENSLHVGECDREGLNLEAGNAKPESRLQKLQKMGPPYEKRAVTRFGAEALQIKSVLSRSRKHNHHPKFAPPVKSPRIHSGKNASRTSRLIDAATRILEPGLQSTNRAKSALTYSSPFHYPPVAVDEVLADGTEVQSPEISKQACYDAGAPYTLMSQTSCKSCGNLVDVADLRSTVEEQQPTFPSFASSIVNDSSLVAEKNIPRACISSFGQEKDGVCQGTWNQSVSVSGQKGIRSFGEPVTDRKSLPPEGQASWQFPSSQLFKPQNEGASSTTLKNRSQMQHRMSLGRERIPPRSKLNSLDSRRASSAANSIRGTKDFIALNRNLSGRAQPRMPTKLNDSKFNTERRAFTDKDDYPSQIRTTMRKRRMINVSGQSDSDFVSSTSTRQVNYQFDVPTGKGLGNGSQLINHSAAKIKLPGPREGIRANGNKETDVISFTFNSPIRNKNRTPTEIEGTSMDTGINPSFQKPLPLSGDDIGALLEQKLRELACQEDDDLAAGASSKRSTAMILQELISALTADRSPSHDGNMANTDIASPVQGKRNRSIGTFHDGDRLSPGSVLEASFSSSSMDDSSGRRSYPHSMDYSDDQLQLGREADLIDCATSVDRKKTGSEIMTALFNNVSRILHSINAGGERLKGGKLIHANEVILNAELLFGDVTLQSMDGMKGLFISPLLLDLETIASCMMTNFNVLSCLGDTKEGTKLSEFLFDCIIEHLDSKYAPYCYSGFRYWEKLPSWMNRKLMMQEVEDEIQKWMHFAGMIPDELIEWDMSHSLGKWTDFNIEAYEAGSEIDGDILQSLVNEVVIDLRECRLGSF